MLSECWKRTSLHTIPGETAAALQPQGSLKRYTQKPHSTLHTALAGMFLKSNTLFRAGVSNIRPQGPESAKVGCMWPIV